MTTKGRPRPKKKPARSPGKSWAHRSTKSRTGASRPGGAASKGGQTAAKAKPSAGSPVSLGLWLVGIIAGACLGTLIFLSHQGGETIQTPAVSAQVEHAAPARIHPPSPVAAREPASSEPAHREPFHYEESIPAYPAHAATPAPPEPVPPTPPANGEAGEPTVIASVAPPSTEKPVIEEPVPPPVARVAIVIDDFGMDLGIAKRFLNVPLPLTFSILPHQEYTSDIASMVRAQGHEYMLHLPMQPKGYPKINPGKGALLVAMNEQKILTNLDSALAGAPYAAGVNNHMGSLFTENEKAMKVVLTELKRRGLFFLDSRTTAGTVGYKLASSMKIPSTERDIFLDHEATREFVTKQLNELIKKAKLQGTAVAVGHPYDVTLEVLTRDSGKFAKERIEVVPLGDLLKDAG